MERRSFLKKFFGTAVVVATVAVVPAVASPVIQHTCDCALRSFWDGPCAACTTLSGGTISEYHSYTDFTKFSQIAIEEAIDENVKQCAKKLSTKASMSVSELEHWALNEGSAQNEFKFFQKTA